tara:strand:+ start:1812 stop:2375 length:564 start_codon:yes stop_codon:yes gene_type:complete
MFDKDYDRVTIVYASQTEHGEKMSYTENLADFGHRERVMMEEILRLWNKSCLPEDFYEEGVKFAMNSSSGSVFLTNSDYQVCMLNGDQLEMWYSLPYSGEEGFVGDLIDGYLDFCEEDQEYVDDIVANAGNVIAICIKKEVGCPCFHKGNEEFGIIKDEGEVWFPSGGTSGAFLIEVEAFPCEDDEE